MYKKDIMYANVPYSWNWRAECVILAILLSFDYEFIVQIFCL